MPEPRRGIHALAGQADVPSDRHKAGLDDLAHLDGSTTASRNLDQGQHHGAAFPITG